MSGKVKRMALFSAAHHINHAVSKDAEGSCDSCDQAVFDGYEFSTQDDVNADSIVPTVLSPTKDGASEEREKDFATASKHKNFADFVFSDQYTYCIKMGQHIFKTLFHKIGILKSLKKRQRKKTPWYIIKKVFKQKNE